MTGTTFVRMYIPHYLVISEIKKVLLLASSPARATNTSKPWFLKSLGFFVLQSSFFSLFIYTLLYQPLLLISFQPNHISIDPSTILLVIVCRAI